MTMTLNYTYNYPQVARDAGFKLRNFKDGPLDWRLIGSLEIERILKDQSLEQIDAVLNHLSEAPLGSILDSNILDSGIAKYFMLSQFSVQYLIFCRKFLEETVTDLRESHGISQIELATLKKSLSEANNEILQLHKKMTQMEAIHEVIYPCHLCTKNFVSNDALNLHISRKHNGVLAKQEKNCEAPKSLCKERENDLTLINTIKLELEIKQLKERINNAEREIKEKHIEEVDKNEPKNGAILSEKFEKISVQSIGIQSNLSEIKEIDDNSEDDLSTSSQSRQQLCILQEKFQEIERWKEEQKSQNSEFLNEINIKLQNIGTELKLAKSQRELHFDNEKQKSTSSIEDFMSKKVDEIAKANADKIEDVVTKMETNYKEKLELLEKELLKLNEKVLLQKDIKFNQNSKINNDSKNEHLKMGEINNEIPVCKEKEEATIWRHKDTHTYKENSASESNHTFVKYAKKDSENTVSTSDISDDDSTDVSGSLLYEDNRELLTKINTNKKQIPVENNIPLKKLSSKPQIMTKKETTKLINHRLLAFGLDISTKSLNPTLKKRISADLNKERNKLKQKHPQFFATRNKIKKIVDKLCSAKMPQNAKELLKVTNPVRHKTKEQKIISDEFSLSEGKNEYLKSSTPLNAATKTYSGSYKQMLERILDSPIRKPDEQLVKAMIHQDNINKKPVPMPRKRVMFNQAEILESRLDHSLSASESNESQSFEHHPEKN